MAVRFSIGQSGVELGTPHVLFPIKDLTELDQLVFPTARLARTPKALRPAAADCDRRILTAHLDFVTVVIASRLTPT